VAVRFLKGGKKTSETDLLKAGLSMGRAARPPYTPDRPSRPPDKGQTGID
jgi:hypothetical protein